MSPRLQNRQNHDVDLTKMSEFFRIFICFSVLREVSKVDKNLIIIENKLSFGKAGRCGISFEML